MKLPFTVEAFLKVFENYNRSIWPLQIVFYLIGLLAVFLTLRKIRLSVKINSLILAFFWLWMGIVYNLIYFTAINPAAYIFGFLFIIQGALFLYIGFYKTNISFHFRPDIYGLSGGIFILFALAIYPIIGYFQGHKYPASPTFGLPCPTTIFTFGLLLLADTIVPIGLFIIPLIWSIIGFSAAFTLGIKEDTGLLIAGLLFAFLIAIRNKKTYKNITFTKQSH